MNERNKARRGVTVMALCTSLAALAPAIAAGAEADRITVEDPATNAVKFRVTSAGNVTGTSITGAPTDGAAIAIQQGPTELGSAVKLAIMNNAGATKAVMTAGGSIGIGTAAPAGLLSIQSVGAGAPSYLDTYSATLGQAPTLQYRKSSSTTQADGATANGEQLGAFNFWGNSGSGFTHAAYVGVYQQGAASTYTPAGIQFKTSNGTSDWATKMILDKDGNVGIGTTTPSQKLEVVGGVKISSSGTQATCDDTIRGSIWFSNGGTGDDMLQICAKVGGVNVWKPLWQ